MTLNRSRRFIARSISASTFLDTAPYSPLGHGREFLREAAQASEKATALARLRYQYGVADFLTVLDAERTMLQAQDQLAQSETATATSLVAVYKALGGGWQ
jgi:hypothetical protein